MGNPIILIVDTKRVLEGVVNRFFNNQCRILFTGSGIDAALLAKEHPPDMIFVANRLPDTDGVHLISTLRQHFPNTPVVLTTENPDTTLILTAIRKGACDVLSSSPDEAELQAVLSHVDLPQKRENGHPHRNGITGKHSFITTIRDHIKNYFANIAETFQNEISLGFHLTPSFTSSKKEKPGNDKIHKSINDALCDEAQALSSVNSTPVLQVFFFGTFHLMINGQKVDRFPSRKGKDILAYLLFQHSRKAFRDELMEKFWPDSDPVQSRNSLNVELCKIRKALCKVAPGIDFICFRDEFYFINPNITIETDREKFLTHRKNGEYLWQRNDLSGMLREYQNAVDCYKGEFIEENLYEEWTIAERERLKEIYLQILEKLSHYYCINGKPLTAITLSERVLRKDCSREPAHRRLMFCYWRLNQRDRAIKQFHKCAKALSDELNVQPSDTTIRLFELIKNDNFELEIAKKYLQSEEI